jgi:MFS transporter, DHA2 family, multidrug resistance protein
MGWTGCFHGEDMASADALRDRLIAGDVTAAPAIGLNVHLFTHRPSDATDAVVEAYLRPVVEKAAFALSINEAWMLIACVALIGLLLVPFAGKPRQSG